MGYRLAKGVFWSMVGSVCSRGLMLIASVVVARMLGKAVFGELGIIRSTVGMFSVFAGFGLGLTATKHVAEFRNSDPPRTGRIISLSELVAILTGGLIALGLFVFAPWLAQHTLNAPHMISTLRIGSLILFIDALNGAQTGALSGFEAFKTIAQVNLFVGLLSFPILIGGAYLGGLNGAVWALAINLGINWLLNQLALRKEVNRYNIPLSFHNWRHELSILWTFSLPAVLSGVLVSPVRWACNALLVNQPGGYGEMGIFSAALSFQTLILFVCSIFNQPLLSMLSSADFQSNQRLETTNVLTSWSIGLVTAIPLLCFPEIGEFLFGASYKGHTFRITFSIILFYTCILTYRNGLVRVLASKNLLWWGFSNNLLWAIVLLPTAYFFAKWGSIGLASSFAIAYAITSVVFVPVYMNRGQVPRDLLISREAVIVWLTVIAMVSVTYFNIPIIYRVLALPFIFCLIGWALRRVWKRNTGSPLHIASAVNL